MLQLPRSSTKCKCYVHIPDGLRRKLDPKAYCAIFVGYPDDSKGYKVYNIETGKFARTRNVLFHENQFHNFETDVDHESLTFPFEDENMSAASSLNLREEGSNNDADTTTTNNEFSDDDRMEGGAAPDVVAQDVAQDVAQEDVAQEDVAQEVAQEEVGVQDLGAQGVGAHDNEVYKTYEETFMRQVENLGRRRERRPRDRLIENVNFAADECNIVESLTSDMSEPKSLKEALRGSASDDWNSTLKSEYESLMKNNTWTLDKKNDLLTWKQFTRCSHLHFLQ